MSRTRHTPAGALFAGALLAGLLLAQPSSAVTCPMLVDPAGDTFTGPVTGGLPASTSLDIVAGNMASDGRVLSVSLQTVDLAASAAETPAGMVLTSNFTLDGRRFATSASRMLGDPDRFQLLQIVAGPGGVGTTYPVLGEVPGVFDLATSTVRVHVPLTLLGLSRDRGLVAGMLTAYSYRVLTTPLPDPVDPDLQLGTDAAEALNRTYGLGTPGCITPGA